MAMKLFFAGLAVILSSATGGLAANEIRVSSPAFTEGSRIPSKFTCDGSDTSPPLQVEGVDASAKWLVLIVDDPDAPGGVFTHWLVWNIDPKTRSIAEGNVGGGIQGKNDFGKSGYGGPCPPAGTHRYYFRVFALDRQIDLKAGADRKQLNAAMQGHVIAKGELMGRYSRQK
jgi:Raf kinase inhibitor-like YbhB/YbcL family protein